jgi:hypothetical protein
LKPAPWVRGYCAALPSSLDWRKRFVSNAYAIVIGIEKYQQPAIPGISYAHADTEAMAKIFEERFDVPPANIKIWLDSQATHARLANDLKYETSQLGSDDRFYFFYAGHGFWSADGGNRLTAWDTNLLNMEDTTLGIEELLLTPLKKTGCKKSALFIDACAEKLATKGKSRDLLTDMRKEEFVAFSKESRYLAAFFACSPGEKSWSSSKLQHGVWTYHLERALRGEEPGAIFKDNFITNASLQDFLLSAVKKFVRENIQPATAQTPYAAVHHTSTAALVMLPEPPPPSGEPLLDPDFSGAYFVQREKREYKALPGFSKKKGHWVPDYHSDAAAGFARDLLSSEVSKELKDIVENARDILHLKYKDLTKNDDENGSGTVDADAFRFEIDVDQSRDDHTKAVLRRELRLRTQHETLPEDFDSIFPQEVDTLVIPLRNTDKGFVELRDAIEERDRDLEADETSETIKFELANGMRVKIDMKRGHMTLTKPGVAGALSLIETFAEGAEPEIAGSTPKLIGKVKSKA